MATGSLSFRYQLEKAAPRVGSGGTTRGASVKEFPASIGIAGVSMRLEPGSMRELHWHANAAEWAYVVSGNIRTTLLNPDGGFETDTFGYAPQGAGHYIRNTGSSVLRVLIGFNDGHYESNDLSAWLASNPASVLATNLGLGRDVVSRLPRDNKFILPR